MKTKKKVLAVLITAVLLISAALIVGCMSPQDGAFAKPEVKDSEIQTSVEKGIVKINLSDESARTILPDFVSLPLANMYFNAAFTPCNASGTASGSDINYPSNGKQIYGDFNKTPIVLAVGYYNVTVTAYDGSGGSAIPIAGWSSPTGTPYEVTAGNVTDVGDDTTPINLIAFMDGADNGKFEYTITYSALGTTPTITTPFAYTSQQLLITTYPGGTAAGGSPITLSNIGTPNSASGSTAISLPSGYYTVTVKLQADSCQDRVLINAMHIYPGMTSKYTPATIPAPNQNQFTVWFDTNGIASDGVGNTFLEDTSGAGGPDFSTRGPKQYPVYNAQLALSPGDPKNDGYNFGGWFANGSGGGAISGDEWDIDSDLVFSDKHLYAKWTPKAGLQFTITFNIPSDAGITRTNNILSGTDTPDDPVTLADIRGGIKSITLALDSSASYSGIQWYIDGIPIGSVGATSITIAKTSAFFDKILPDNIITVTGTKGGAPYSKDITIELQ